ncbi:MAG: hypothetical protein HY077_00355 [Elusimicrobia bacterium]|nr:hypothetical protein [Elusimicrobiota bacterium]
MKYWVYMNGEVPGSYTPAELVALNGFSMTSLVCPAEGEILEKNWRRSGEFSDIIKVLHERDAKQPPSAPSLAQESVMTADVNQVIDTASTRLFSQVSHLMKELENRREERALTVTLQRQVVDLKDQLLAAQDKLYGLEGKMPRIAELEEIVRKDETAISNLESALKAREEGLGELRQQTEKTKIELENTKRRLGESLNDLSIRNRLVDKLSRDLTEKELSLAKSLGVIRRLEEDLNRLCPVVDALAAQEPAPAPAQQLPSAAAPAEEAPKEQPAAQGALVDKFKKLMGRSDPGQYDH